MLASVFTSGTTTPMVAPQTVAETVETIATVEEIETTPIELKTKSLTTEEKVREYFKDVPIMAEVAFCESRYRQYNADGNVLRGMQNPADVGVMQINEKYHSAAAVKLGLNLHTLEGNMAYARYLYDNEGTRPWKYSSHCWGDEREVAIR